LEDVPQIIILLLYSSSVTGWSLTALLSVTVGITAVVLGVCVYSWNYNKASSTRFYGSGPADIDADPASTELTQIWSNAMP
jgi:hypothetical protein